MAGLLDLLHDPASTPATTARDPGVREEIAQRFALVALFGGRVRLPVRSWGERRLAQEIVAIAERWRS